MAEADVARLPGPSHRTVFRMPSLGSDMESGTVVAWEVAPGSFLARGGILLVVEAEKGELDVEVFEDCILEEQLAAPGAKLEVGTPLAILRVAGEAPDETIERAPEPTPAAPEVRASPRARRRAAELGVDLAGVRGSGPEGAITFEDVEAAAGASPEGAAGMPGMRKAIAAAMSRSNREIPHYYLWSSIDVEDTLRWLEARNQREPIEARILPAALLVAATARAAARVPALNGLWRNDGFEPAKGVHLGVAISLRGGGLVNPAIADAERKPLADIMASMADLVARARSRGLRASELAGPTLTVTDLGDLGVDGVLPVIHPPQVAMVGFGRIAERPWVVGGAVVARRVVTACLAADHRATDGRIGAQLLVELERLLRDPARLEKTPEETP